jgi:hypothetical protein
MVEETINLLAPVFTDMKVVQALLSLVVLQNMEGFVWGEMRRSNSRSPTDIFAS